MAQVKFNESYGYKGDKPYVKLNQSYRKKPETQIKFNESYGRSGKKYHAVLNEKYYGKKGYNKASKLEEKYYNLSPNSTKRDVDNARKQHRKQQIDSRPDSYKNHKYLYKYVTDSGKVRYVYETKDGKRKSYSKDSFQNQAALSKGGDGRRSNRYLESRKTELDSLSKNTGNLLKNIKKGNFDKASKYVTRIAGNVPKLASYAADQVKDSVSNGLDFVSSFFR